MHNFSPFTIFLPKSIKIGENLTKSRQKQFCKVFLRHGVYTDRQTDETKYIISHQVAVLLLQRISVSTCESCDWLMFGIDKCTLQRVNHVIG